MKGQEMVMVSQAGFVRFVSKCFQWWCRSSSGDIAKPKRMFHHQDGDIQRWLILRSQDITSQLGKLRRWHVWIIRIKTDYTIQRYTKGQTVDVRVSSYMFTQSVLYAFVDLLASGWEVQYHVVHPAETLIWERGWAPKSIAWTQTSIQFVSSWVLCLWFGKGRNRQWSMVKKMHALLVEFLGSQANSSGKTSSGGPLARCDGRNSQIA